MLPSSPVPTRAIRPLHEWRPHGWRIKVYGIAYQGERPSPALVARAQALAEPELPRPAVAPDRYGVGFLGVHEGRGADLAFLDWWADENELHHRVWHSRPGDRAALAPAGNGSPAACAWDLRVIAFERDAWMRHVLRAPGGPDLDAYLAARLDEDA